MEAGLVLPFNRLVVFWGRHGVSWALIAHIFVFRVHRHTFLRNNFLLETSIAKAGSKHRNRQASVQVPDKVPDKWILDDLSSCPEFQASAEDLFSVG